MYFFDGKLGAYERMMTQKPGFYRRSGKSGKKPKKDGPKKIPPQQDKRKGGDKNGDE